jgi:hypothetical protein
MSTVMEILRAKVEELKKELPCISLGYLGNYERWGNDTQWAIFLPHYGRVGTYGDQISLGAGRDEKTFTDAVANWDKIAESARKRYAADPNRIGLAKLNTAGNLVEATTGCYVSLGINPPPRFDSLEAAAEYLTHYNTPCVVVR